MPLEEWDREIYQPEEPPEIPWYGWLFWLASGAILAALVLWVIH